MSILCAQVLRAPKLVALCSIVSLGWYLGVSIAHVGLDSPNGGESLTAGETFSIDWHVEIRHNTLNWDLELSTASANGPWQSIVDNLAAGNINDGAPHSFDWIVPNIDAQSAWVRVRQDNAGRDYYDVSDASFSIAALHGGGDFTGDGAVDAADLAAWVEGFGTPGTADPTDGDADLDGDVDGADFLHWQGDFGATGSLRSAQSVPEPAATLLLAVGLAIMFWIRRR